MPVSKAQQKATNKYISKAYDRVNLTLPKGQKDEIQAHAAAQGESVNAFINRAISEAMERDKADRGLQDSKE
ncbi:MULTISPECIES: ribbon-helix-helix domain-containing protein [Eubacteriales]|uniref:ribbon-helix-helix domain-containing protein n=1 Tax=Eubacteriales TaxID=186802 RepID=UPI0029430CFF|nr:ribbon-helix-helix protein, CopG family [Dysosmobacter welbionis]